MVYFMSGKAKKIIAVASNGGHWVQLRRLSPAFDDCDLKCVYVSTENKAYELNDCERFHLVRDCNFNKKISLLVCFYQAIAIFRKEKADIVISTGAAPGLMFVLVGRLFGARTVWVDSIANSEKLSASGRAASIISNVCYTQWPNLSTSRVKYLGNVL